ncbi:MAG: hypothetical protein VB066_01790 [Paludibacter sp.]|nr:hypothetical protein [Paludibacter sp.]
MRGLEGQTVIDIAVQESGSAEAAYRIAQQNGISLTDDLQPMLQQIEIPEVVNKQVATYYANRNIKPATASEVNTENVERVFFEELPVEFT